MAGNIKGITIELNGDTTKLDKALRNVNRETQTLQRRFLGVEKALKMDPGNADMVMQKTAISLYRILRRFFIMYIEKSFM